jgi:hypothetical protein
MVVAGSERTPTGCFRQMMNTPAPDRQPFPLGYSSVQSHNAEGPASVVGRIPWGIYCVALVFSWGIICLTGHGVAPLVIILFIPDAYASVSGLRIVGPFWLAIVLILSSIAFCGRIVCTWRHSVPG